MINYQGMCAKTNFQRQMTYNLNKNIYSSVSLDRIDELCSAVDSLVVTVHENFTSKHQIKILSWQDATCEIHCMKQIENMKT